MTTVVDGKNFLNISATTAAFALKGGGPKADGTYVIRVKDSRGRGADALWAVCAGRSVR